MTNSVVAFGEILMRLSPEGYCRFKTADRYDVYFGGAEANSAETLSQLLVFILLEIKNLTTKLLYMFHRETCCG